MSTSITQHRAFLTTCDRCQEVHDHAEGDLEHGCYCPDCQDAIIAANANPVTDVRELLDEIGRNRYKALYALHLGEK